MGLLLEGSSMIARLPKKDFFPETKHNLVRAGCFFARSGSQTNDKANP